MRVSIGKPMVLFRRFATRQAGSAAVEFALIAPFLIALYTGSVEVVQGIIINRQVGLVASTVANITAQYTTISAANDIPDIFNAASQILAPYSTTPLKVVVSSIQIDSSSKATVLWSKTKNGTARTAGSTITVPASLVVPSSGLVLAEVTYGYTPGVNWIQLGTLTLSSATYMVPRDATLVNIGP
jgi:Flp pilus assembly protein TadG